MQNSYDYTGSFRFTWSLAYIALLWVTGYGAGLPDIVRGRGRAVATVTGAPLLAALGVSVTQLVLGDSLLPRFVVFGSALVLAPWYLLCIAVASRGRALAEERDRVFLIATPEEAERLETDLRTRAERPAQLVGLASPDQVHGSAAARVKDTRATVVVVSRDAYQDERLVHDVALLHESGLRVRTLALFYEQWLGKLPISELERTSLMFDIREVHRARYARVSRLLDLGLSVLGVIPFAAAIPFVVVGNLIANRGPLFYKQPRVGKNGAEFDILKFRTMRPDEGRLVNEWTSEDDPRITRFGRILRMTHVDELAQVLNILRGELSVVGPRPEQPHYVDELTEKIPYYNLRHLVRPGLTGWAQVKYGYAGTESDALEKLQYEFFYLRHQGLGLDVRIIARTIRSVFGRHGR